MAITIALTYDRLEADIKQTFADYFDKIELRRVPESDETIHDRINNRSVASGIMMYGVKDHGTFGYFFDLIRFDSYYRIGNQQWLFDKIKNSVIEQQDNEPGPKQISSTFNF